MKRVIEIGNGKLKGWEKQFPGISTLEKSQNPFYEAVMSVVRSQRWADRVGSSPESFRGGCSARWGRFGALYKRKDGVTADWYVFPKLDPFSLPSYSSIVALFPMSSGVLSPIPSLKPITLPKHLTPETSLTLLGRPSSFPTLTSQVLFLLTFLIFPLLQKMILVSHSHPLAVSPQTRAFCCPPWPKAERPCHRAVQHQSRIPTSSKWQWRHPRTRRISQLKTRAPSSSWRKRYRSALRLTLISWS